MKKPKNNQEGAALFLAIMLLGFVLTIGIAIIQIQIRELRFGIRENASAMALFAADAGLERTLYKIYQEGDGSLPNSCTSVGCYISEINLTNGSSYYVIVPYGSENPIIQGLDTEYIVLRSLGQFQETQRSLEVNLYQKMPPP